MIYEIGLTLEKIPFKKFIEFYMPLRRSQLAINNNKKKKKIRYQISKFLKM